MGFIFATLLNTPQSKVRAPALVFTNPAQFILSIFLEYSVDIPYCKRSRPQSNLLLHNRKFIFASFPVHSLQLPLNDFQVIDTSFKELSSFGR